MSGASSAGRAVSSSTATWASGPSPSSEPRTIAQRPVRVRTRARPRSRRRRSPCASSRARTATPRSATGRRAARRRRPARRASGRRPGWPSRGRQSGASTSSPVAGVDVGRGREQGGSAHAVGQRRGERRHELRLRRREARAPGLAQQRERAPRAGRAGEDHPQLVVEAARPPQLAVAGAPVQLTCRGLGQSGRGQPSAGQVGELVDVRFADLDLREADGGARRERVLHDVAGGQEGGGVHGEQARAVERDGPAQ